MHGRISRHPTQRNCFTILKMESPVEGLLAFKCIKKAIQQWCHERTEGC